MDGGDESWLLAWPVALRMVERIHPGLPTALC
jgi:hypothetical protein